MKSTVIITGATRGIGRALVYAFARKGFDVAFCSGKEEDCQALLEELASIDGVKEEYDSTADKLAALEAEMDALAIQNNQETIVMYATVGLCGVLAVMLIILLVKRKK